MEQSSQGAKIFARRQTDQVHPPHAVELQRSGAVLRAVREDDECVGGHASGAVPRPLERVGQGTSHFRGEYVVTPGRSAARSERVADLGAGGVDVRHAARGISAGFAAGLPTVRDDGSPGTVV